MDTNTSVSRPTDNDAMKPYVASQSVKPTSNKGATIAANPKPVGKSSAVGY